MKCTQSLSTRIHQLSAGVLNVHAVQVHDTGCHQIKTKAVYAALGVTPGAERRAKAAQIQRALPRTP